METHHLHASTPGIDHGHVMGIQRRLAPWQIEQHVLEQAGSVEWHLVSSAQSEQEMLRHLRQAVMRETGQDSVRCESMDEPPPTDALEEGPDAPPEQPVIL